MGRIERGWKSSFCSSSIFITEWPTINSYTIRNFIKGKRRKTSYYCAARCTELDQQIPGESMPYSSSCRNLSRFSSFCWQQISALALARLRKSQSNRRGEGLREDERADIRLQIFTLPPNLWPRLKKLPPPPSSCTAIHNIGSCCTEYPNSARRKFVLRKWGRRPNMGFSGAPAQSSPCDTHYNLNEKLKNHRRGEHL